MAFEFTPHRATVSNLLWAVTSGVGAALCFLVLLIIAAVWCHPKSCGHLDRVSFRIVVYALFTNMIFGIASAVGGTMKGPGFLCGFSIFVLQLTLELSSFLLFCIALNLQLVVVHGFNGQRMEKFYIMGSALMSVILAVPPYAAGQYGWDPLEQVCWYTNDNVKQRVTWQVTTQMAWTALTVVGELICSTTVMVFMLRHTVRLRRVFHSSHSFSQSTPSVTPHVIHANNYKQIILRVALYPIASCCVNLLSVVTALHSTVSGGIHDVTDYNILLLSDFLYGGRAIVYALLAASDPALVRGVKTLFSQLMYGPQTTSKQSASEQYSTGLSQPNPFVVHIELSTVHSPPLESPLDVGKSATSLPGAVNLKPSLDHQSDHHGEVDTNESVQDVIDTERRRALRLDLRRRKEEQEQGQDAFKRQI